MVEKRSIANNNKTRNHSISVKTACAAATMVIGIPILLILSAIAISSVSIFQLIYSQGPATRQQQDLNDLSFQTTSITVDGISYPLKYNITSDAADLVGATAEKESAKLILTIAPVKDGKLTITLPRNLTDYKIAEGKDGKFLVNINAKQATNFQEISSNKTARELEINFSKDDRVIEVVGTQMGQGDIATIKGQATEMTAPTMTNMTENVTRNNASGVKGNASQTGESMVNQTGEAAQTFVNKTAGILGNVTGEVSELFGANN